LLAQSVIIKFNIKGLKLFQLQIRGFSNPYYISELTDIAPTPGLDVDFNLITIDGWELKTISNTIDPIIDQTDKYNNIEVYNKLIINRLMLISIIELTPEEEQDYLTYTLPFNNS